MLGEALYWILVGRLALEEVTENTEDEKMLDVLGIDMIKTIYATAALAEAADDNDIQAMAGELLARFGKSAFAIIVATKDTFAGFMTSDVPEGQRSVAIQAFKLLDRVQDEITKSLGDSDEQLAETQGLSN